jgi:hypothetical protein
MYSTRTWFKERYLKGSSVHRNPFRLNSTFSAKFGINIVVGHSETLAQAN